MTKQDLIDKVADSSELSKKQAADVIDCVVDSITDALADGDKVSLIGFGTFEARERAAREGRNPRTGDKVSVEEKWVPFFKTGKELRERLNE